MNEVSFIQIKHQFVKMTQNWKISSNYDFTSTFPVMLPSKNCNFHLKCSIEKCYNKFLSDSNSDPDSKTISFLKLSNETSGLTQIT